MRKLGNRATSSCFNLFPLRRRILRRCNTVISGADASEASLERSNTESELLSGLRFSVTDRREQNRPYWPRFKEINACKVPSPRTLSMRLSLQLSSSRRSLISWTWASQIIRNYAIATTHHLNVVKSISRNSFLWKLAFRSPSRWLNPSSDLMWFPSARSSRKWRRHPSSTNHKLARYDRKASRKEGTNVVASRFRCSWCLGFQYSEDVQRK